MVANESRFSLLSSDRRFRVWRRPGRRFLQSNISKTVPYGGWSVMVKSGITSEAKTDLHVFPRGNLTALGYKPDILEYYVVPCAPFVGNNFILMHDNARPHVAIGRLRALLVSVGLPGPHSKQPVSLYL